MTFKCAAAVAAMARTYEQSVVAAALYIAEAVVQICIDGFMTARTPDTSFIIL